MPLAIEMPPQLRLRGKRDHLGTAALGPCGDSRPRLSGGPGVSGRRFLFSDFHSAGLPPFLTSPRLALLRTSLRAGYWLQSSPLEMVSRSRAVCVETGFVGVLLASEGARFVAARAVEF